MYDAVAEPHEVRERQLPPMKFSNSVRLLRLCFLRPGRCAAARTGDQRPLRSGFSFLSCRRSACPVLVRYARRPGLGFEVGDLLRCRGASFPAVNQLSMGLRRGGREAGGSCSRLFGIDFLLRSRHAFSVHEAKNGGSSFGSVVVRRFWSRGFFGSDGWFSSVRRFRLLLSLVEVCAGGSHYHGGEFSSQAGWCSRSVAVSRKYCQRFKRRSSMLLRWPLARLPHLLFFSLRSLFCGLGCSSTNFSRSVLGNYGRLVALVSLAASLNARSSLTSQHHIGLFELLWWCCVTIVCRSGSG
ncbi:LOW QUALITY PROTEIN: hypothetical protein YC2023_054723 [Brassica napus]